MVFLGSGLYFVQSDVIFSKILYFIENFSDKNEWKAFCIPHNLYYIIRNTFYLHMHRYKYINTHVFLSMYSYKIHTKIACTWLLHVFSIWLQQIQTFHAISMLVPQDQWGQICRMCYLLYVLSRKKLPASLARSTLVLLTPVSNYDA